MPRTIAEALEEKGRREEVIRVRQEILLRHLRIRFGQLPAATLAIVEGCRKVRQLDKWLDRLAVAKALSDVGICAAP